MTTTWIRPVLSLLAFLAALLPARAEEALEPAVRRLLAADSSAARAEAKQAILALKPAPAALAALLERGLAYSAPAEKGWSIREIEGQDGVKRPWHLFVPPGYDPAKRHPVLASLHGGVSRKEVPPQDRLVSMRKLWEAEAAREGFLHVLPTAQLGAEWWTDVGAGNVLSILAALKRDFNVDENRVLVTGFSDGGSGAFFLALFHSTPFAGFLPLSGHLLVAQEGSKRPVYLPSLRGKPLLVMNGGKDPLYPASSMEPFAARMKELGIGITFRAPAEAGHDPSYLEEERPRVVEFLRATRREPHPATVEIETASAALGARKHWVRIEELGAAKGPHAFEDANVEILPPIRLGIEIDTTFAGPGVRVKRVTEDSVASRMGLAAGDQITRFDGTEVKGLGELRQLIGAKKHGHRIGVEVRRGEASHTLAGAFPAAVPVKSLDRSRKSGRIAVAVEGNQIEVRASGVLRYSLLLSPARFDLSKPIAVRTNGRVSFEGLVSPDASRMLDQAAGDQDRSLVYWAQIEVKLEAE